MAVPEVTTRLKISISPFSPPTRVFASPTRSRSPCRSGALPSIALYLGDASLVFSFFAPCLQHHQRLHQINPHVRYHFAVAPTAEEGKPAVVPPPNLPPSLGPRDRRSAEYKYLVYTVLLSQAITAPFGTIHECIIVKIMLARCSICKHDLLRMKKCKVSIAYVRVAFRSPKLGCTSIMHLSMHI